MVKSRPKVNPFGDAKPREVLLEEQGKDWRKLDRELEHRGVDRSVMYYVFISYESCGFFLQHYNAFYVYDFLWIMLLN